MISLPRHARTTALAASLAIALVGIVAGAVRLLPWLLDPSVPWRVAAPFARGLSAVALEAALLVGWPMGWALACYRFVESGEARVMLTLGESPAVTVRRLAPQGALLALALAGVALVYGSDASAPGRVATELVAQARASCLLAEVPTSYAIPFTDMTWLCAPPLAPRLVGAGPGSMAGAMITASQARIAGDFRALELDDAHILLSPKAQAPVRVQVGHLVMRGMAPWASASTLPPAWRALWLALAAWSSASLAAYGVLVRGARSRLGPLALGASGPVAALGLLRWLERSDAPRAWFALVPVVASLVCWALPPVLSRLRWPPGAASR